MRRHFLHFSADGDNQTSLVLRLGERERLRWSLAQGDWLLRCDARLGHGHTGQQNDYEVSHKQTLRNSDNVTPSTDTCGHTQ